MVERIVSYVPTAETVLNLSDGSFIDPKIARKWMETVNTGGGGYHRRRTPLSGSSPQTGLVDELTKRVEKAVDEVTSEKESRSVWGDVSVKLVGEFNPAAEPSEATIRLRLQAFAPNYWSRDLETAKSIEARELQEQAFASYRIAEHMIRTVENLELANEQGSTADELTLPFAEAEQTV